MSGDTLLPKYICHKQVWAAKIEDIEHKAYGALLVHQSGAVMVDHDWITRNPKLSVGGYYVVYEKQPGEEVNYSAYSPANAFESGYSLLSDVANPVDSAPLMRAKMRCAHVESGQGYEVLEMHAVCKSEGYPEDGSDENNTFARWTPSANLRMTVNNPALHGLVENGDEFYVDFTKVTK